MMKPGSISTTSFLPVTLEEINKMGWDQPDIILVSGDAYVDHPAFGTAVIARLAEYAGFRVAILPQPNWQDDLRDFKKFGAPRYFFGVTAGAMDSMVNHYTALKRKRSDDAYTPGGRAGYRPDMPSVVYTRILKSIYPRVPVVLGGVEASMRRFTHYDYWRDKVLPSVLVESGADMLLYGMGEQALMQILQLLKKGVPFDSLHNVMQTAFLAPVDQAVPSLKGRGETILPAHDACVQNKGVFAQAFRVIEEASNTLGCDRLIQPCGPYKVIVNPPFSPPTEMEADLPYDLPYTRLPHPKYRRKPPIPAWEMIRFSVNIHRGCFGGCSFCAIAAHQGKFVVSRSEESVMRELENVVSMPGFKGHVTDLGGPSANMYRMGGVKPDICRNCRRPSCIFPAVCHNLNYDHQPLNNLYDRALQVKGVKKITIGSGVRYDLLVNRPRAHRAAYGLDDYMQRLFTRHVSGRLKVAPEHTSVKVLQNMRKPAFALFEDFLEQFRKTCRDENLPWQMIPYFISGHPGCFDRDMENMARIVRRLGLSPEHVQEFTPTPMTLATTMYYTGIDPYTGEQIHAPRENHQKRKQKSALLRKPGGVKPPGGFRKHRS